MKSIRSNKIIGRILASAIVLCAAFPVAAHADGGEIFGGALECFSVRNLFFPDVFCLIGKLLHDLVWSTFGQLVFEGAMFFQSSISLTMQFASFVRNVGGIQDAWSVFRDAMNIAFIFLLLYASIRMILGLGKHEAIIKSVITAGLLINFSFFITSIIIDASNMFVIEFNEAIVTIGAGERRDGNGFGRAEGISAVFMQGLGIRTAAPDGILTPDTYETHILQQLIFSSITFLITAFVFYAMGFLLVIRFLILIMLLITSPVAFMGGFPQLAAASKQWWSSLIGMALFAPIMLLFLTVTAVIISSPKFHATFLLSNTVMIP